MIRKFNPLPVDFDDFYTLDPAIIGQPGTPGLLETYGEDYERVKLIRQKTPRKLWTCVEGDEGTYYSAGFHFVNRCHYVVTLEEWTDENEEYQIWNEQEDGNGEI